MSVSTLSINRCTGFCFIVAVFVPAMLTEIASAGQTRTRVVRSPECPYLDDAVVLELTSLRIADREISFDMPFEANDDWLAHLVFRVINRGRKPIAAIVVTIGLLEGLDEQLPTYASYDYGLQFVRSNQAVSKKSRSKLRTLVAPGKEVEITANGSRPYGLRYMDALLEGKARTRNWAEVAAKTGARFHRAEMMRADIWFTDGTKAGAELFVRTKCDGMR